MDDKIDIVHDVIIKKLVTILDRAKLLLSIVNSPLTFLVLLFEKLLHLMLLSVGYTKLFKSDLLRYLIFELFFLAVEESVVTCFNLTYFALVIEGYILISKFT